MRSSFQCARCKASMIATTSSRSSGGSTLPASLAPTPLTTAQIGLGRMRPQPVDDLLRAAVGREDGIEDVLDPAVRDDERQALQERRALELEGRQAERTRQLESGIA